MLGQCVMYFNDVFKHVGGGGRLVLFADELIMCLYKLEVGIAKLMGKKLLVLVHLQR